jgi:hypothetical protein
MKKISNLLFLLSFITAAALAQNRPINKSVDKEDYLARYPVTTLMYKGFEVGLGIDKNTKWIDYYNVIANQPLTNYVFLKGTKTIMLFGYLPKDSANYYRYNIIENDNKLLATNAKPVINGVRELGHNRVEINLGTFNIENKKLSIETYKITSPRLIKTGIIYNKEIEPAKVLFLDMGLVVQGPQTQDGFKLKLHDKHVFNPLLLMIKPTDVAFIYAVYLKNLTTGQKDLVSNNWLYDYTLGIDSPPRPYMPINSSFFSTPGDYELQIVPTLPGGLRIKSFPEKTTTFHFTVLPSDAVLDQKTVIKFVIDGLVAIACIVFIVFYMIKIRNKKLLTKEKQQKDMAQLQLDAVRSQLNPHFLFNALAGIQNLMNKTDIDQANRYLTKFARLTRNVLNNKDLINLSEEKDLLDDYLQMEQMRFGFNFEISIDPNLDISNVQIPSMLLHPFVENAVKHGLPSDERTGKITISISKKDNDLELTIIDNGKGFSNQNDGLGLQLSKKRIALLNTIYKDSPIMLDVQSGSNGTVITITLTHWL